MTELSLVGKLSLPRTTLSVVGMMGIECTALGKPFGFAVAHCHCVPACLDIGQSAKRIMTMLRVVGVVGIEPTATPSRTEHSTDELHPECVVDFNREKRRKVRAECCPALARM